MSKIIQLADTDGNVFPNPIATFTWTPQVYDATTYKASLPSMEGYRIGRLYILPFSTNLTSNISIATMFQIRGLPTTMTVIGGQVYYAGTTGQLGDRTVQIANSTVYFRPNWTGTFASGSVLSGLILGIA